MVTVCVHAWGGGGQGGSTNSSGGGGGSGPEFFKGEGDLGSKSAGINFHRGYIGYWGGGGGPCTSI